jgi:hypothetical protein
MKSITLVASLAAASVVVAAVPTHRIGTSRVSHSCDLELNVIDPDPLGPNVRSAPSVKTGKVIARFAPQGEWTYVHVVGQAGAWLLIDRATVVDDAEPDGEREVFRGGGWMHRDTLGLSELLVGEGTVLREGPDAASAIVRRIATPDDEPARVRVLGCRGKSLHVDIGDGVAGWTDTWCNNERTTCS